MKILHINSYYSVSSFYKNLYEKQVKNGHIIDVFVPISSNIQVKDFDFGEYTKLSKNHAKYDRLLFHLKHSKIYNDIQKKYKIEDYSITHAHSLFSNGYIAMKLKKKYGIPYVVAVRNTDVNIFFNKMIHLRKLGVNILKEASHIIFLSKTYEKQVIENYVPINLQKELSQKISIIPNGIDSFWLDNIGKPKMKLKDDFSLSVVQVGDINKNKNILATVKAMQLLTQLGYTIKLDIVGKIKDQNLFKKIINYNFVNYLGYKSKEELINIYRENDIFVLPSINETFGLVYAEAMSQGLPVIYTKGQGFDTQFKDGNVGYSVDCFSEIEIAKKIISIKENYENISNYCIKSIDTFKWEKINDKYLELYKSLREK